MTTVSFSDFNLPAELLRALEKLGFTTPTPVQAQVIPRAMAGGDLLVSAATGSGKTAAFLLPMLQRFFDQPPPVRDGGTRGLVLAPTRELAQQTFDQFFRLGSYSRLTAGLITGGAPGNHQIATLRKNPHVLIATPGRLLEHLKSGEADLADLEILVLDEADRMLDMGFAEEVLEVLGYCAPGRQSILVSATLHHRGLKPLTDQFLRDPEVISADPARALPELIRQQVVLADDVRHKEALTAWLLEHETFQQAVVFTNTREGAARLGDVLRAQGVRAGTLHGEMEQRERNRIIGLLRNGKINVLVATDVAARGLDVPGIDLVINFDVARSGDDHLHRTGRTGRAGAHGLAVSLVGHNDWNNMASIERYLRLTVEWRELPGLKARFSGPKKPKSAKKNPAGKRPPAPRTKERERNRKNVGKRRQASSEGVEAGHAPLKKKPKPPPK